MVAVTGTRPWFESFVLWDTWFCWDTDLLIYRWAWTVQGQVESINFDGPQPNHKFLISLLHLPSSDLLHIFSNEIYNCFHYRMLQLAVTTSSRTTRVYFTFLLELVRIFFFSIVTFGMIKLRGKVKGEYLLLVLVKISLSFVGCMYLIWGVGAMKAQCLPTPSTPWSPCCCGGYRRKTSVWVRRFFGGSRCAFPRDFKVGCRG